MPQNGTQTPPPTGLPLQRTPGLVLVSDTPKGRGVFASQPIPSGTVIDISPVLIFTEEEVTEHTSKTKLDCYTYYWPAPSPTSSQSSFSHSTSPSPSPSRSQALALGLGSLFNHSRLRQNVGWKRDLLNTSIIYLALRDIAAGEELCISYGGLWFEDADSKGSEEDWGGGCNSYADQEEEKESEVLRLSGLGGIRVDVEGDGDGEEKYDENDMEGNQDREKS